MPVFNEERTAAEMIRRVRELPLDLELIVVDDGSTDSTREILARTPGVDRLLVHEKNRGKGAAIRTGLAHATGETVVIQDADLEYDPKDFLSMLEAMEKGPAKVVYGSRILGRNPMSRPSFYFGGRLLSFLTNALYGTRITDEPTCYKMFRREVLQGLDLRCEGFEFCPEVTAKVARRGFEIVEVPIRYEPRDVREGKKIRWRDGWIAIRTLVTLRFSKDRPCASRAR
ncbi:MAG: glycosyltransferase family 2 protein [Thermoanaerobaculia bacterium]